MDAQTFMSKSPHGLKFAIAARGRLVVHGHASAAVGAQSMCGGGLTERE